MDHHAASVRAFACACWVCACAAGASAQDFALTVSTQASQTSLVVDALVPLDGTLIGDYDPATNPGGTQTRPGVFGGSGNNPIPLTVDLTASGDDTSAAAGAFGLGVDVASGAVIVRNFTLDLLAAGPLEIDLVADLLYQTFHTVNPTALFPGGTTIPLPLGTAQVSTFRADYAGPGIGTITPTPTPGVYEVAGLVPVSLTLGIDAPTGPIAPPPLPAALPLTGTLTLGPGQGVSLDVHFGVQGNQTLPGVPQGIQNLPLDLPTVLPPGGVAHLLVNADILEGHVGLDLDATVGASGQEVCRADFTGDGTLDLFDYLAFLNAFAAGETRADLNSDAALNLMDYLAFTTLFAAGC